MHLLVFTVGVLVIADGISNILFFHFIKRFKSNLLCMHAHALDAEKPYAIYVTKTIKMHVPIVATKVHHHLFLTSLLSINYMPCLLA